MSLHLSSVVMLFMTIRTALAMPLSLKNYTALLAEEPITHVGKGTWFQPGLGSCGQTYSDNDPIVAIAASLYNQDYCGQWLQIVNKDNGKSVWASVGDKCPGCNHDDLDMSPSIFSQLADLSVGVVQVSWHFMPKQWHP